MNCLTATCLELLLLGYTADSMQTSGPKSRRPPQKPSKSFDTYRLKIKMLSHYMKPDINSLTETHDSKSSSNRMPFATTCVHNPGIPIYLDATYICLDRCSRMAPNLFSSQPTLLTKVTSLGPGGGFGCRPLLVICNQLVHFRDTRQDWFCGCNFCSNHGLISFYTVLLNTSERHAPQNMVVS